MIHGAIVALSTQIVIGNFSYVLLHKESKIFANDPQLVLHHVKLRYLNNYTVV